jgi:hypothetical protein
MRFWKGMVTAGLMALCLLPGSAQQSRQEFVEFQDTALRESSGLAASRRTPGVLWTHNDSGGKPVLFATDRKGRALARFKVTLAASVDWEDIAAGPGTGENATLYIGDIGDNHHSRKDTAVYRVPEPEVDMGKTGVRGETMIAEKFPFLYPDGHHDAETLLVHPVTGEIYIVTKDGSGVSGVYKFPMPLTQDRTATLQKVCTLRFNNPLEFGRVKMGRLATGGSISPDGTKIIIRTYAEAYEWRIRGGQKVEEALAQKPRPIVVPVVGQFEGICYSPDGKTILTTTEGVRRGLLTVPCSLWEAPAPKQGGK